MKQVYDPVRCKWIMASPEEIVRQTWIHHMIYDLQFPKGSLIVERELLSLPYLQIDFPHAPSRRVDILSLNTSHSAEAGRLFQPLLLIECKCRSLNHLAFDQLLSYNTFIQAPFVALVNQKQIRLFCCSTSCETHVLPSFFQLIEQK